MELPCTSKACIRAHVCLRSAYATHTRPPQTNAHNTHSQRKNKSYKTHTTREQNVNNSPQLVQYTYNTHTHTHTKHIHKCRQAQTPCMHVRNMPATRTKHHSTCNTQAAANQATCMHRQGARMYSMHAYETDRRCVCNRLNKITKNLNVIWPTNNLQDLKTCNFHCNTVSSSFFQWEIYACFAANHAGAL